MKWKPFPEIEGCGLVEFDRHTDDRGYFQESWNKRTLAKEGIPLPWGFAQTNSSFSYAGVLRGFHFQANNPQGKLVTCLLGQIMDVCLDMRPHSPTFLKMTRVMLDASKPMSFWLPPGTAHAFLAFEDSLVEYKCSTLYDKESDTGVNSCSPEVQMVWPAGTFIRSERDRNLPTLNAFLGLLPSGPGPS